MMDNMDNMNTPSTSEIKHALTLMFAVSDVIRASGADGVGEGFLYTTLMGRLSMESYESLIGLLIRSKAIERRCHRLYWRSA